MVFQVVFYGNMFRATGSFIDPCFFYVDEVIFKACSVIIVERFLGCSCLITTLPVLFIQTSTNASQNLACRADVRITKTTLSVYARKVSVVSSVTNVSAQGTWGQFLYINKEIPLHK